MFRIVDRGGAVVAASAAVVCLATLSWIATGGSSSRYSNPAGYPGGGSPSLSAPSTVSADGSPAAAAPQPPARTGNLGGTAAPPYAPPTPVGPVRPASGTGTSSAALPADASAEASESVPPTASAAPPSGITAPQWSGSPWSPQQSDSPEPTASDHVTPPAPLPPLAPSASATTSDGPVPATPSAAPTVSATATATGAAGPSAPGARRLVISSAVATPDPRPQCRDVVVTFHNGRSTPVRSGRVVITAQVVDPLGIAWSTHRTVRPVPVPVAPGADRVAAYDVCLPDFRGTDGTGMRITDVALLP